MFFTFVLWFVGVSYPYRPAALVGSLLSILNRKEKMRISIFRMAHFNAAHRLHNDHWTDEKNEAVYGKCNNPHYHGHNYEVEVRLTGEVDEETGFLFDLGELKHLIKIHIEDRYDHKNLNLECPEFKDINPSAEYICFNIHKIMREVIDDKFEIGVKLWETPRNYVQYPA